jgi:hypothetical protein
LEADLVGVRDLIRVVSSWFCVTSWFVRFVEEEPNHELHEKDTELHKQISRVNACDKPPSLLSVVR